MPDEPVEVAFIVDGFPQDGQHLMNINATTNPPGDTYYGVENTWHYDDTFANDEREILVIGYGQGCKQYSAGQECILRIDLYVTGKDVYNVEVTTRYIPEVCQREMACDMRWNHPKKRCCLYDAYQNEQLDESCVNALKSQAQQDVNSILGEESDCRAKKEIIIEKEPRGKLWGVILALSCIGTVVLCTCCLYVVKVSEKRKMFIRLGLRSGEVVDSNLRDQLLLDSKLDSKFGGILPGEVRVDIGQPNPDIEMSHAREGQ